MRKGPCRLRVPQRRYAHMGVSIPTQHVKHSFLLRIPHDTNITSQVKALESRLKSVESLLAATKETHPSPAKSSTVAVSPQADSTAFQFRLGPPSSWQALGRLPSAVELLGVKVDTAEIARVAAAIPSVELSDFPDPEGYDQVLHYFFNKINPFYGILHEGLFRALVPGLWQGTASPQTIHAAYGEYTSALCVLRVRLAKPLFQP